MRLFVLALVAACKIDSQLNAKDEADPAFDTGEPLTIDTSTTTEPPPPDEECNGVDDNGDGVVDEGFPDENANGQADCLDLTCPPLDLRSAGTVTIIEECQGTTSGTGAEVDDPWNVQVKWQYSGVSSDPSANQSWTTPVIGNLDDDNGDGVVDDDDSPEVVTVMWGGSTSYVVAIDGATGVEKWAYGGASSGAMALIADVDADGFPDVVSANSGRQAIALEGDGTLKWTASELATAMGYQMLNVADLDMDGMPEVLNDDLILNGEDGTSEFKLNVSTSDPYRLAGVADIDDSGDDQEILMCGAAYDSDGSLLWDSGQTGTYGFWPVIIEQDGDAEAEIGFAGQRWSLYDDDGSEIYSVDYNSSQKHPGPPCAGDFDGDGVAEVAFPSYQNFVMYELDGTEVWSVVMDDTSGLAGCSGYDVNGDGPLEILFADQSSFKILDGATGSVLYQYNNHASGTIFEYPSVADLDADGHTEIVFVSNRYPSGGAGVTALEHAGDGWPAAGSTWGIHDFAMTNINSDGSVPQEPEHSWTKYNVYRSRIAVDDPSTPDLLISITDVCVMDCTYGPVAVAVQVRNQGGADSDDGTPMALYALQDTGEVLVATYSLPVIAAGTSLEGIEILLNPEDAGEWGFIARVDDDGTGVGTESECDETNNEDDWRDGFCP